MNDTAIAFAGGVLCGIFAGAFLLSILILTVVNLADEDNKDNKDNNDNNDNKKKNF